MEGRKFHLPVRLKAEEVEEHLRNRRCIIVAFFGKSPLAHRFLRHFFGALFSSYSVSRSGKGAVLDEMLGRPVFYPETAEEDMSAIEGYFDPDRDTVFLHMK